jgi:hypothetical protein
MKLLRIKFSLRTLSFCATVVALFFGVSQIHRRKLTDKMKEFESKGVTFSESDSWIDWVWMRVPREAPFYVGPFVLPGDESQNREAELKDFGVANCHSVDLF